MLDQEPTAASQQPTGPGACEGLTVVDFGQGMSAGMATMILADSGASVIKVEPPWGDWARAEAGFLMWNRGKRSAVLDLRRATDHADALELVCDADVVVEAFRPGVADRLGIGYEDVAAVNPAAVYCSISGFGTGGDLAQLKGYEGIVAAICGRMTGLDRLSGAAGGHPPDEPVFTVAPVASYGAAQLAVQGILAALHDRRSSGQGQLVQTSLLQAAMVFLMRQELPRGKAPTMAPIAETAHRGIELCFLTAECSDGRYIQMCARQDRHFRSWLQALGLGELLEDPRYAEAPLGVRRMADLDELEFLLRARMRERTQDEWMAAFIENDVGADPFLVPDEFLAHPDMVANDRVVEMTGPAGGPVRMVGPLVSFSKTPSRVRGPAPSLGQHTLELRSERRASPSVRARPDENPAATSPQTAPERSARRPPLAGFTIIEAAYFIAGPLATTLLAELGARVIKVEPFGGDPYRRTGLQAAKFLHGKESITLDLKRSEGSAILHALVARSDAFVHSFRPGVPERLGLDYPTLCVINPRLTYLYAASYGSNGPQRARAAFHSTPNALAGGGILQAGEGNPPVDDSYPDPGSALAAATALMLGLSARDSTGTGQYLETSMLASTGYVLSGDLVRYNGAPPLRTADHQQRGLSALYRIYRCAKGWLFLAAIQDAERRALRELMDLNTGSLEQPDGCPRDDALLAAELERRFSEGEAEDWARKLTAAGLAAAVVSEAAQGDWFTASGLLQPAEHPLFGPYWRPSQKIDLSASEPCLGPAVSPGENSRQLLEELGFGVDEIDQLIGSGVVGEWTADHGS